LFDAEHRQIRETQAEIIDENSFSEIAEDIHIAGDCQEKLKTVLKGARFHFHPEAIFPSARGMAAMAESEFIAQNFEDVAYFEPFYLKDFIAGKKA
jgi:tRNA threonylcarbamoyladenosine biosynthesis protein TsaB